MCHTYAHTLTHTEGEGVGERHIEQQQRPQAKASTTKLVASLIYQEKVDVHFASLTQLELRIRILF